MKTLRFLAQLFVGLIFVFSGFTKCIDPVGSATVFTEYFKAFGLGFLQPTALFWGLALSTLELVLGIMLLTGVRMRQAACATLGFMGFFTLLTLFLALTDKVQDCGCFGEFVKLTNWQTFYKNLIILPVTLFIFVQRKRYKTLAAPYKEYLFCVFWVIAVLCLSLRCYLHLPLMDVMGFKVGNHIPTLLQEAQENPEYVYETVFIYSKDGKEARFEMDALPDSTWTFVDALTTQRPTGVKHRLTDFAVRDLQDNYVGEELLAYEGPSLWLLTAHADKVKPAQLQRLKDLAQHCAERGIPFYCLAGSAAPGAQALLEEAGLDLPLYLSDYKTLLTMVRTNPGLLYMQGGSVVAKWGKLDFPDPQEWEALRARDPEVVMTAHVIDERLAVEVTLALGVLFFLILPWIWLWIAESRQRSANRAIHRE